MLAGAADTAVPVAFMTVPTLLSVERGTSNGQRHDETATHGYTLSVADLHLKGCSTQWCGQCVEAIHQAMMNAEP